MKKITKIMVSIVVILWFYIAPILAYGTSDSLVLQLLQETKNEIQTTNQDWLLKINQLQLELVELDKLIFLMANNENKEDLLQKVNVLLQKDVLRDKLDAAAEDYQLELSKIRYRKGIELIKMIYEKILGLDHHFTSLQTYQNVIMLSNPHSFPEFKKAQDVLKEKMNKKQSVRLPSLLESNPYISMTYTLVASVLGGGDKKNREKDLNQVACILDFTVRMNADLHLIYYETEFLKESNRALKAECIELFKDYAKVVGYHTSLLECRKEDDWETMYEKLNQYLDTMKETSQQPDGSKKVYQQQVNLEFSIDRLLQFMDSYSAFISQGEKYYQKFETILNNYANEDICQSQLPHQFRDLKKDIEISILKFNEAYNISELQGSKLKDLMYGIQ